MVLTEQTCPILRDTQNDYKPLERLFGTISSGMAFGESTLLSLHENKNRFYNAVAMSESYYLQINK